MAKLKHLSKYYADDKDIQDLFSSGRMTHKRIQEFCLGKGIVFSKEEGKDELIDYLSRINYSWKSVTLLLEMASTSEREDKMTPCIFACDERIDSVVQAFTTIKNERETAQDEVYTINQVSDKYVEVTISYSDLDHSKTRVLQRIEKTSEIQIVRKDGKLDVRHHNNEISKAVVNRLQALLRRGEEEIKREEITLHGVRDPLLRSGFFKELMNSVYGFDFQELTDVRVESAASLSAAGEQEELEEEIERRREKFKTKLKKAMLSGTNLETSKEFQSLTEGGFFISKVVWQSVRDTKNELAEFEADFKDPVDGTGFQYEVKGVWERNSDGEFKTAKKNLPSSERNSLRVLVENAAFEALGVISEKASTTSVGTQQAEGQ